MKVTTLKRVLLTQEKIRKEAFEIDWRRMHTPRQIRIVRPHKRITEIPCILNENIIRDFTTVGVVDNEQFAWRFPSFLGPPKP